MIFKHRKEALAALKRSEINQGHKSVIDKFKAVVGNGKFEETIAKQCAKLEDSKEKIGKLGAIQAKLNENFKSSGIEVKMKSKYALMKEMSDRDVYQTFLKSSQVWFERIRQLCAVYKVKSPANFSKMRPSHLNIQPC